MASQGPNNPGSGVGTSWINAGNITLEDSSPARHSLPAASGLGETTTDLIATDCDFDIPLDAIIDGIKVEIKLEGDLDSGNPCFEHNNIFFTKNGSSIAGSNLSVGGFVPSSYSYVTFGGPTTLGGSTWTPAEINASTFGVIANWHIDTSTGTREIRIDHIRITVYYTISDISISITETIIIRESTKPKPIDRRFIVDDSPAAESSTPIIADKYGNIFQYSESTNSWINQGSITSPTEVTSINDGIITNEHYNKLILLRQTTIKQLKISPAINGYWYYFKSNDKRIKFNPESNTKLRVEINQQILYHQLLREVCRGPKGDTGEKGEKGNTDTNIINENCYEPTIVNDELRFAIQVSLITNDNISLRLYKISNDVINLTQSLEFDVTIDSDVVLISNKLTNINITKTINSIQFNKTDNILSGVIYLLNNEAWNNDWCVRAAQRGPNGDDGDSGNKYINIIQDMMNWSNIVTNCPIINVRHDDISNSLITYCDDLLNKFIVNLVSLSQTFISNPAVKINNASFMAISKSAQSSKSLSKFTLKLDNDKISDLAFSFWEPQTGCVTKRNFDRHNFNWQNKITADACGWLGPTDSRSNNYPYSIVAGSGPTVDACCEDEFFYCPNVQDVPGEDVDSNAGGDSGSDGSDSSSSAVVTECCDEFRLPPVLYATARSLTNGACASCSGTDMSRFLPVLDEPLVANIQLDWRYESARTPETNDWLFCNIDTFRLTCSDSKVANLICYEHGGTGFGPIPLTILSCSPFHAIGQKKLTSSDLINNCGDGDDTIEVEVIE